MAIIKIWGMQSSDNTDQLRKRVREVFIKTCRGGEELHLWTLFPESIGTPKNSSVLVEITHVNPALAGRGSILAMEIGHLLRRYAQSRFRSPAKIEVFFTPEKPATSSAHYLYSDKKQNVKSL